LRPALERRHIAQTETWIVDEIDFKLHPDSFVRRSLNPCAKGSKKAAISRENTAAIRTLRLSLSDLAAMLGL